MIRAFLEWLTDRLPVEEISHRGEKFMERYYLATLCGWRAYIHRFIASDPDGVHDHPWRWGLSLILSGWYLEQRRRRTHVRRWFNLVNGETFHRVIVPRGAEVWTLFIHDRRCKSWGFLRPYFEDDAGPLAIHIYEPFGAPVGHGNWHLTAPTGRELRAMRAAPMPAVFRSNRRPA